MKRGDVMLAYGLNKNLKKFRNRPKSAKPKKQKKAHKKVFEENLWYLMTMINLIHNLINLAK